MGTQGRLAYLALGPWGGWSFGAFPCGEGSWRDLPFWSLRLGALLMPVVLVCQEDLGIAEGTGP